MMIYLKLASSLCKELNISFLSSTMFTGLLFSDVNYKMDVKSIYKFILVFSLSILCSSCIYLGRSEYYNEVVDRCFYLETKETLYILFGIDKCCKPWFKSILPSELQVGTVHQILYIIEIHKNGKVHSQGFLLNTPMNGFYTVPGIYLLRIDNDILIFDYCKSYLLQDNGLYHCEDSMLLSSLMNGYYDVKRKTLADWNKKHGYRYGEIRGLYGRSEQTFAWEKAVINLTVKWGNISDNETIITIACPEILNHPMHLVIPKEYIYSHFTPNDKELPHLILEEIGSGTSAEKLFPNVLCLNKKTILTVDLEYMLSGANNHQEPTSGAKNYPNPSGANIHPETK